MTLADPPTEPMHTDDPLTPMVATVVRSLPLVREEAVGRARLLLASSSWCRADEVADRLVYCWVGRRVP